MSLTAGIRPPARDPAPRGTKSIRSSAPVRVSTSKEVLVAGTNVAPIAERANMPVLIAIRTSKAAWINEIAAVRDIHLVGGAGAWARLVRNRCKQPANE